MKNPLTFIPSGPLSEEAKTKLAKQRANHEARLARLAEDAKNSIIEKGYDGYIKITIPNLGIITWAKDVEDAKVAITEAVDAFKSVSDTHGEGFEKELKNLYDDVDNVE